MTGPQEWICLAPAHIASMLALVIPHGWDGNGRRCEVVAWLRSPEGPELVCTCGNLARALAFSVDRLSKLEDAIVMKKAD